MDRGVCSKKASDRRYSKSIYVSSKESDASRQYDRQGDAGGGVANGELKYALGNKTLESPRGKDAATRLQNAPLTKILCRQAAYPLMPACMAFDSSIRLCLDC